MPLQYLGAWRFNKAKRSSSVEQGEEKEEEKAEEKEEENVAEAEVAAEEDPA